MIKQKINLCQISQQKDWLTLSRLYLGLAISFGAVMILFFVLLSYYRVVENEWYIVTQKQHELRQGTSDHAPLSQERFQKATKFFANQPQEISQSLQVLINYTLSYQIHYLQYSQDTLIIEGKAKNRDELEILIDNLSHALANLWRLQKVDIEQVNFVAQFRSAK